MRLGIVGCGAAKLDTPAPARALYTSTLFQKCLAVSEAENDATIIVSAKHYNIGPDEVVAPYELRLGDLHWKQRGTWASIIRTSIFQTWSRWDMGVTCYAGREYAGPLRQAVMGHNHGNGAAAWWREPLAGLGVGYRLQELNKHRALVGLADQTELF